MYWAHVIHSQLRKKKCNENKGKVIRILVKPKEEKSINHRCGKCGQNPYFCQCDLIINSLKDKFNFEKSDY
jgi:hypothetical protein